MDATVCGAPDHAESSQFAGIGSLHLIAATSCLAAVLALAALAVALHTRPQEQRNRRGYGAGKRSLPRKIILIRHAESLGNIEPVTYTHTPDSEVPLTERGKQQAYEAGVELRNLLTQGPPFKIFCIHSPYRRTIETSDKLRKAFNDDEILGVQEEVQLREQDYGNFQNVDRKKIEKEERLRYGRFFYRFPNGESGADVYDRMTILEDFLIRDINAGRFPKETVLVLVTHGLAMRIFLMRWFCWTIEQMLAVWNPENSKPIVLECMSEDADDAPEVATKAMYRMSEASMQHMPGCTEDMCNNKRYHALRRNWEFNSIGAASLARPLLRVPSSWISSPIAAHTSTPDPTQHPHTADNSTWGTQVPGTDEECFMGLRTAYAS